MRLCRFAEPPHRRPAHPSLADSQSPPCDDAPSSNTVRRLLFSPLVGQSPAHFHISASLSPLRIQQAHFRQISHFRPTLIYSRMKRTHDTVRAGRSKTRKIGGYRRYARWLRGQAGRQAGNPGLGFVLLYCCSGVGWGDVLGLSVNGLSVCPG